MARRNPNVLLERIQSDMKMVLEHVDSDDVWQSSVDIRNLQNAVTTHSSEIRGLRGDLGRLRREFEDARQ